MEERLQTSDLHREGNLYSKESKNEKELYSVDYECSSKFMKSSDAPNFDKFTHKELDQSKESVELSLEVEITDSLKQLIACPEKHDSELLDVTIVRPSDIESVRGTEISTSTGLKTSEVRKLIAKMEREKSKKMHLIEECKKKVESCKMNPIMETHEVSSNSSEKEFYFRKKSGSNFSVHKRRLKRGVTAKHIRHNIAVMSAPTKTKSPVDGKLEKRHLRKAVEECDDNEAKFSSVSVLKPLVGKVKQSLKNLEFRIAEVGDHKENRPKKAYSTSSSTESNGYKLVLENANKNYYSRESPVSDNCSAKAQQVYATVNTFDKIRNLLECQNKANKEHNEDKPCMCQHCGMVGLLVESQKRPIMNLTTQKRDEPWNDSDRNEEETVKRHHRKSSRNHTYLDEKLCKLIRDLAVRLESLENRVTLQEQRAVPKSYFRRVINKLLNYQNSRPGSPSNDTGNNRLQYKSHATQYCSRGLENVVSSKHKKESKVKPKYSKGTVRCSKRRYHINPVLIQTDSEAYPSNNSEEQMPNKKLGSKAITVISDFFTKLSQEKEEAKNTKKTVETNTSNEKNSTMENLWKWGEEIIKPGFDLKTKIVCLLEDQFQTLKSTKPTDVKAPPSRPPTTKIFRHNATSPLNLFEAPTPYEDKEVQKNSEDCECSSRTLRKVLDLMSEKIYNEQVKPTVDALKYEHKNKDNTRYVYNVKVATKEPSTKLPSKQTHQTQTSSSRKHESPKEDELFKNTLKNLDVHHSFKENDSKSNEKNSKASRKSGIPIRITSVTPTESTVSGLPQSLQARRSLIPRLKSSRKKSQCRIPRSKDNAVDKSDSTKLGRRHMKQDQFSNAIPKKHCRTENNGKFERRMKPIQITYMNPKVGYWNEESSASVPDIYEGTLENKSSVSSNESVTHTRKYLYEHGLFSQDLPFADKVAHLCNVTNIELDNPDLWSNILKKAKNHSEFKQDIFSIQIPIKQKYHDISPNEIEFTIDDIQNLIKELNGAKLPNRISRETKGKTKGNGESFVLIRSGKIMEEVRKRLANKSPKEV